MEEPTAALFSLLALQLFRTERGRKVTVATTASLPARMCRGTTNGER
jgi:hypothetical protein